MEHILLASFVVSDMPGGFIDSQCLFKLCISVCFDCLSAGHASCHYSQVILNILFERFFAHNIICQATTPKNLQPWKSQDSLPQVNCWLCVGKLHFVCATDIWVPIYLLCVLYFIIINVKKYLEGALHMRLSLLWSVVKFNPIDIW